MDTNQAKPKKFALPKLYVRNHTHLDATYEDNLCADEPLILKVDTTVQQPSLVIKDELLNTDVKEQLPQVETKPKPKPKAKRQYVSKKKVGKAADVVETLTSEPEPTVQTVPKAVRKPSAYNIFIKDTLENLKSTHAHLTSKEKFTLAIQLWNERKNNTV
jgi:hypothetical protein